MNTMAELVLKAREAWGVRVKEGVGHASVVETGQGQWKSQISVED